ncbi:hypothetical protein RRG08_064613 [Elysia crispata]|uniref:Uncharacterized protein n=1 Tax=Elysia crispata TaxID=231223 RepID=A0AAE1EBZ6_9GAST|nr:hypothetical protein RRG08_064613 [Elysia crispata]
MSSSGRRDADGRSYRAIPETLGKPLEGSAKQSVVDPAIPGRGNTPAGVKSSWENKQLDTCWKYTAFSALRCSKTSNTAEMD